jgi:hypothetical protein
MYVLDYSPERPGRGRTTRHSDKRNLWGNPSGPGRPFRRSILCCHFSQPTKNKDTESRRIPTGFCHSRRTAGPPRLPHSAEEHIRREAGKTFADGVEDPDIENQLLLGGEKTVNEALRQALVQQAVLLAPRSHKMSAMIFWGSRSPPTRRREARKSACWSCGDPGHFQGSCTYGREEENDRSRKHENRPTRDTRESPRKFEWRLNNHREADSRGGQLSGNRYLLIAIDYYT